MSSFQLFISGFELSLFCSSGERYSVPENVSAIASALFFAACVSEWIPASAGQFHPTQYVFLPGVITSLRSVFSFTKRCA